MPAIEFGRKDDADVAREEHAEHLCPDDDRRQKTVRFQSDTPDRVLDLVRSKAAQSRDDNTGPGQAPLSDHERDRIDFSKDRANVPWAQSIKAYAMEKGVDDWIAHLDDTLTVDENKAIIDGQAGSETTMRDVQVGSTGTGAQRGGGMHVDPSMEDDVETGHRQASDEKVAQVERHQNQQCNHAEGHCEHGDADACEFLRDHCGYTEYEVEDILGTLDPDDRHVEDDPLSGKEKGVLSRSWGGYQGAVSTIREKIEAIRQARDHAERAMAAINSIREEHGQDPLEPEALQDLVADLDRIPEEPEATSLLSFRDGGDDDVDDEDLLDSGIVEEAKRSPAPVPPADRGVPKEALVGTGLEPEDMARGMRAGPGDAKVLATERDREGEIPRHPGDVDAGRIAADHRDLDQRIMERPDPQADLSGEEQARQGRLAVETDPQADHADRRHEQEQGSLLADDRSDPSRGHSAPDAGDQGTLGPDTGDDQRTL